MKNVLFVDCCIRGEASRTKKARGRVFVRLAG